MHISIEKVSLLICMIFLSSSKRMRSYWFLIEKKSTECKGLEYIKDKEKKNICMHVHITILF